MSRCIVCGRKAYLRGLRLCPDCGKEFDKLPCTTADVIEWVANKARRTERDECAAITRVLGADNIAEALYQDRLPAKRGRR